MTAAQFRRLLPAGAKLECQRQGHWWRIAVEAPPGHHWLDGEPLHELLADVQHGPAEWRHSALDDLSARMLAASIAPCGVDCEWWNH